MPLIRSLRFIAFMLLLLTTFTACLNTRKQIYFDNIQDTILAHQPRVQDPIIQKSDLLNISVSSLNPEASLVFNTPNLMAGISPSSTGATGMGSVGAPQFVGYLVDMDGDINFPIIGKVKAEGMTKKSLENSLRDSLSGRKLLIDPIVSIRFLNFRVTILGEVARPSTINVSNEKISILEALGLAGDLTVYGKRDNVLLVRETDSTKIVQRIDLNSKQILSSPYYYLKNNDVVYVEARKEKVQSTSRTQQLLPIYISVLSFLTVIAVNVFK